MKQVTFLSLITALFLAGVLLSVYVLLGPPTAMSAPPATASEGKSPLPLPSTKPLEEFEALLYPFLEQMEYQNLSGWVRDKKVRDTGPYINKMDYGTHPAVRVFYSPEVYRWLKGGREGSIPDGAIIVKEMYDPPAAQYEGLTEKELQSKLSLWTVMIKDSAGAKDGWFWSFYAKGQKVDTHAYPFDYPNSGFGSYCVRCHASAEKEFTFSAFRNMEGEPGDPIIYRVDDSWMKNGADEPAQDHAALAAGPDPVQLAQSKRVRDANADFLKVFNMMQAISPQKVVPIPNVTYDHVVSGPKGPAQFITSDQCLLCHGGLSDTNAFGPTMFIPPTGGQPGVNPSPFGEWNWSMMGLSGRDPIFYAQLESELTLHAQNGAQIQNTCFSCHGVMGQRQLGIDHPGEMFEEDIIYSTNPEDANYKYGALARDSISCTVCHQIVDDKKPLEQIFTGQFEVSSPGQFEPGVSYIYGPFDKPATLPMHSSLGMKPVKSDYVKSSRLCASCHVVVVNTLDKDGKEVGPFFEQTTYLEWLNSAYDNELHTGSDPKTCQACHMTDKYQGQGLAFRIATIQDQTYPESDHLAPIADITVPIREGFARHSLHGINIFGLEMFNQFDDILGVRKTDFMTGSSNGLPFAIAEGNRFAKEETARVELLKVELGDEQLTAQVKVTNLTGHRFPSGVGFRRAFLEFKVIDASNTVIWASGQTNSLGIIVDGEEKPLPSEFFAVNPNTGEQAYQPHYQTITRQDQVQIYEELVQDTEGKFTTSFLSLYKIVKDNRLLPNGWTKDGPPGFKWAEKTMPHGDVLADAQFLDGTGSDIITYQVNLPRQFVEGGTVVATLYYQATPPYYLRDRFTTAKGKDGQRLYYLSSHLNLEDTHIENWKLMVSSASAELVP